MYVFLDTLTCSFKMVQIILPNVVYLQWMFKYIQQWNTVGKQPLRSKALDLLWPILYPTMENGKNCFIKLSTFTFSILFN